MSNTTIWIDGVDLPLLNKQRRELHGLLEKNSETNDGTEQHPLWGLLGLLDHICDKYDKLAYGENCQRCGLTEEVGFIVELETGELVCRGCDAKYLIETYG